MSTKNRIYKTLFALLLAVSVMGAATQPLAAQATIPEGSSIDAADFWVYVTRASNQTVYLHRITADWAEGFVTWNTFASSFDPTVLGTFVTDSLGWHSVDITALVQAWVDGFPPNYGIVMRQDPSPYTTYLASEYAVVAPRPKLEILYTTPGGDPGSVTIQRPGGDQDGVADAYI